MTADNQIRPFLIHVLYKYSSNCRSDRKMSNTNSICFRSRTLAKMYKYAGGVLLDLISLLEENVTARKSSSSCYFTMTLILELQFN